jgi:hypothetical protein
LGFKSQKRKLNKNNQQFVKPQVKNDKRKLYGIRNHTERGGKKSWLYFFWNNFGANHRNQLLSGLKI